MACGEWKPTDLHWCKAEDNETFTADPAVEASITLLSQRTQKYYWVEFGNQIRKQREELYPILFCVWTIWALLLFYGVSVWGSAGQESSWMNSILFLSLLLSKLKEVVGDNLHTLCSVPTRYAVTTLLLYTTVLPQFCWNLSECFCKVKEEIQNVKNVKCNYLHQIEQSISIKWTNIIFHLLCVTKKWHMDFSRSAL